MNCVVLFVLVIDGMELKFLIYYVAISKVIFTYDGWIDTGQSTTSRILLNC